MSSETINLLIQIIVLINTLAVVPLFKFIFYSMKEISYIKGHLNLN